MCGEEGGFGAADANSIIGPDVTLQRGQRTQELPSSFSLKASLSVRHPAVNLAVEGEGEGEGEG